MRRAAVVLLALCLVLTPSMLLSEGSQGAGPYQVEGYVVDGSNQGLPGAQVEVGNVSSGTTYSTITDGAGHYYLLVPVEGTYNISARLTNYSADPFTNVVLPSAPGLLFNFTMDEVLGVVSGFVTDGGQPVNGATVRLSNNQRNYSAVSQAPFGAYEITGVEPGVYVAWAEKVGYERANYPAPVGVSRSVVSDVNFTLTEQPAMLFGKVLNQNNDPLQGVRVSISSSDYDSIASTDKDGNYSFSSLAAGNYMVTYEIDGYQTTVVEVNLGPFEERRLDIAMDRDTSNQTEVLFGFDLPHSIMVVGLMVGVALVLLALIMTARARRRPERLAQIEVEDKELPRE